MHAHVMAEITFGRMPEKRTDYPRDIVMNGLLISGFKCFAVAKAMKHQPESAFKKELSQVKIGYRYCPPNPTFQ